MGNDRSSTFFNMLLKPFLTGFEAPPRSGNWYNSRKCGGCGSPCYESCGAKFALVHVDQQRRPPPESPPVIFSTPVAKP